MTYIKLVSNLKLSPEGLMSRDCEGQWSITHRQQGDMDGACAVYSLVMNLVVLGYLSDDQIDVINKRTSKGKFLSHFFDERGLVRNGYCYKTLCKEIRDLNPDLSVTRKVYKDIDKFKNFVQDCIDDDLPVIISTKHETGNHALLAVGIEYNDNNKPIGVLCLDPSAPSPRCAKWNCYIDISKGRGDYPYWNITDKSRYRVDLSDMILIELVNKVDEI